MRRCEAQSVPASAAGWIGPLLTPRGPHNFIHELAPGRMVKLVPATRGPDGHTHDWWEWDDGWAVLQRTRCLRHLSNSNGGGAVWTHPSTLRFWKTRKEERLTRAALATDVQPPMHPFHGCGGCALRPIAQCLPGVPRYMRGHSAQPGTRLPGTRRDLTRRPATGHRPEGPGDPGMITLHPETPGRAL